MWQYGKLPKGWSTEKIGEYASVITDYVANGSFAALAENVNYKSEPDYAVLIRLTDYNNNFNSDFVYIDEHAYEFLSKSKLYGNEIIISNVGANVGTVFKCPKLQKKMSLAPNAIMLKTKGNDDFYYYWFTSRMGQHSLQSIVTGSAQPKFNKTNFKELLVPVPPLDVQEKIAEYLCNIDKKIELNKKINKNLELQAQELFKAWFVTFETFGRKMPSSWSVAKLGDIATIKTNSFSPAKNPTVMLEHYSIPAFDEQKYPVFELASNVKSNKYILTDNSVMISKLNPGTKRVWRPMCISEFAVSSTEFIIFEANDPTYKDYVFSVIDSPAFSDWMCAHTTGSTNSRQRTTPSTTLKFQIALPTQEIVSDFCKIVTPMYDMIAQNTCENRKLAAFRDSLLPKLMSGELDVSNIEI